MESVLVIQKIIPIIGGIGNHLAKTKTNSMPKRGYQCVESVNTLVVKMAYLTYGG